MSTFTDKSKNQTQCVTDGNVLNGAICTVLIVRTLPSVDEINWLLDKNEDIIFNSVP